jgi:hypothetical protein
VLIWLKVCSVNLLKRYPHVGGTLQIGSPGKERVGNISEDAGEVLTA